LLYKKKYIYNESKLNEKILEFEGYCNVVSDDYQMVSYDEKLLLDNNVEK
tara:strand:- start:844 stop:993 length:150 start_codon:yes stop_codon:yes gene_type:complete